MVAALAVSSASLACNALTGGDDLEVVKSSALARGSRYDAGATDGEDGEDEPSSGGGSGGGSAPVADAGAANTTDAGAAPFVDDFARANGPLGNGWVERTTGTYALASGAAQQSAEGPLPDVLAFRPTSEDALDVEVSAAVRFAKMPSDPGLYARMQPTGPRQLNGYSFYVWSPTDADIGREDMDQTSIVASFKIAPALSQGETVRLVFKVVGTDPVQLTASVVDGSGVTRGTTTVTDGSAQRVAKAGATGFGATAGAGTRYDDFRRAVLVP